MDGYYQDEVESLRSSGGRMILKMGFRTLTSPKRSADRDKNEPSRFLGDGVSFRAKLIGILEVGEARGERMCQEALADLKMAVRAAGEHKQRIAVCVAIDGLRLRDDKTGDCLYHHPVHKISFIAQDMTDSRAFGYIFGSPDTGHRFFGIKTDKAASQVVIAMRDLFQVVFELKKKEIEMAKQHIEQQQLKYSSSGTSKYSDSSSKDSGDQGKMRPIAEDQPENGGAGASSRGGSSHRRHTASSAAVVAISPPPRHPNALQHQHQQQQQTSEVIPDLLDLEIELNSIQAGIHQMEKMTPSDPFGPGATTPSSSAIPPLRPPSLPMPPEVGLSPTTSSVEDPFGDSFVGPSTSSSIPAALPPPPQSTNIAIQPPPPSSLSTQSCKGLRQGPMSVEPQKSMGGGIVESSWFERPLGSEDLFGEVLPSMGADSGAGREQEKSNVNGTPTQASVGGGDFNTGRSSAGEESKGTGFDVFTELDPLGTGRSRPYVDKKDFFQELKNPPKKVLRDLVGGGGESSATPSVALPSQGPSLAAAAAPVAIPSASSSTAVPFASSTAPLFHAMFDSGHDQAAAASELFSSSDLFFSPPSGGGVSSLSALSQGGPKGPSKAAVDSVFPGISGDHLGSAMQQSSTPAVTSMTSFPSSLAASDAGAVGAEDPFADTDPFADEDPTIIGGGPIATSLSDVDVAGIFPRIEDDPFDTGFAEFGTLSVGTTARRKRTPVDHSLSASATLGRRPRSSGKGAISHGPLRVSLPPEKGASSTSELSSPSVFLPPPPGSDGTLSTGTIPRSRSRSPRLPRQTNASGARTQSPKSAHHHHHHRRAGALPVMRTPSEGTYSSSPQSPPEPPPRPPSSSSAAANTRPPPLPPKRVAVGPTTIPSPAGGLHHRMTFPDDEDDSSQYEFINQYETSHQPTPSSAETKRVSSRRIEVGLPPPPRRQHQRASPSAEQISSVSSVESTRQQPATQQTIPVLLPPPQSTSSRSSPSPQQQQNEESSTPSFDLTLAELGRMSIADLATALHIPQERVATMTLQELAEMLSASRAKLASGRSPERIRPEKDEVKRDRYAALRESVDEESVGATSASVSFTADFEAKFEDNFDKGDVARSADDVFKEAPFDKYAVFRELIESEGGEKGGEEVCSEEPGLGKSAETVDEEEDDECTRDGPSPPAIDASASDASKDEGEGLSPSRSFEGAGRDSVTAAEAESVAGKEDEEESSREEATAEDKYAALREICLMGGEEGEEEGEGKTEGKVVDSEERRTGNEAGKKKSPSTAAVPEVVDLLVLSRQASEAPEEEEDEEEAGEDGSKKKVETEEGAESLELTTEDAVAVRGDQKASKAKAEEPLASSVEKDSGGWANFEMVEKAAEGADSEELVSPWSSEGKGDAVGGWVGDGSWAQQPKAGGAATAVRGTQMPQRPKKGAVEPAEGAYGTRPAKWVSGGGEAGYARGARWRERRCVEDEEEDDDEEEEEDEDEEEEEEEEEERRGGSGGRRGRVRRNRRTLSPWGGREEEGVRRGDVEEVLPSARRRCWEDHPEEGWGARRPLGRGSSNWEGPPPRRARPPPMRTRKPSTWGDEEDEGEEEEWPSSHRGAYEEELERGWRTKKRRPPGGRRRAGSAEWDAECEDEGEEEEEEEGGVAEGGGRWVRRRGWEEEEPYGGAWGTDGARARHRGAHARGSGSRSYRSWDEEDEAEEDYGRGEGGLGDGIPPPRWTEDELAAEEAASAPERRRRRARTASGESGSGMSARSVSSSTYARHFRYDKDEPPHPTPPSARGRERVREWEGSGGARRRAGGGPGTPSGGPQTQPRKSGAGRWQHQQQWRGGPPKEEEEEDEGEGGSGGRWVAGRRGPCPTSARGGVARRGRQRGKETGGAKAGGGGRTPSRGSSGGRLQSPFEDDFVHPAGGGSSVSSDVSETRRSPVTLAHNGGRSSDDVFLPCEGESGMEAAGGAAPPASFTFGPTLKAGPRGGGVPAEAQRPFSAPVEGARHHHQQERNLGSRDRTSVAGPLPRPMHRSQRQSSTEPGNGSIRKSESVNIFARDSDPFDDDFFSAGGGNGGEKGGRGSRQPSAMSSDPFKWTEPFDNFEFREEEEEDEEEDGSRGGQCREGVSAEEVN